MLVDQWLEVQRYCLMKEAVVAEGQFEWPTLALSALHSSSDLQACLLSETYHSCSLKVKWAQARSKVDPRTSWS